MLNVAQTLLLVACFALGPGDFLAAQTAATVNGHEIETAEVEALLLQTYGRRTISEEGRPYLLAQALDQLIDRRLVEEHLKAEKLGAGEEEIDIALKDLKTKLETNRFPLEKYLEDNKLTEPLLRNRIAWTKHWEAFLGRKIDDKALAAHFQKHKPGFDGSQLRVAHLLFKSEEEMTAEVRRDLVTQAEKIRGQIADGTLTFEQAVDQFSSGTKAAGGDLGFIERRGDMPEPFSVAAFALAKNEISPPVVTQFGVHLIRWTENLAGDKQLAEDAVRRQVRLALAKELFETLAAQARKSAKIEFSGQSPYLDPSTGELVKP